MPLGQINQEELIDNNGSSETIEDVAPFVESDPETTQQEGEVEETQPTESATDLEDLFSNPNPLNLTMTYDESSAVEAEIDETGGILELETQDGIQFTLEIPEKALMDAATIRMTPALKIDGLPNDDENAVAVSLQPTGLVFLSPVKLTISPISIEEDKISFGFGTLGNGENFHLQLSQETEEEIVLFLSHFSDHGVSSATEEEMERIRRVYQPTQTQVAGTAIIDAVIYHTSRLEDDVSDESKQESVDTIIEMLDFWHESVVLEKIQLAKNDPNALDIAVAAFLHWKNAFEIIFETYNELLENAAYSDHFDRLVEDNLNGLAEAHRFAIYYASSICRSESDPNQAFKMYHHTLSAEYLDLWGRAGLEKDVVNDMLSDCFNFDFVFRSQVDIKGGDQDQLEQVAARFPLNLEDGNNEISFTGGVLQQEGELVYERIEIKNLGTRCNIENEAGIIGVSIKFNTMNINYQEPWDISDIDLSIQIKEDPQANSVCAIGTVVTTVGVGYWRPFYHAHVEENELYGEDGSVLVSPLPIGFTTGVFAGKEFSSSHKEENGTAKVISDYRLEHKPGQ